MHGAFGSDWVKRRRGGGWGGGGGGGGGGGDKCLPHAHVALKVLDVAVLQWPAAMIADGVENVRSFVW